MYACKYTRKYIWIEKKMIMDAIFFVTKYLWKGLLIRLRGSNVIEGLYQGVE